LPAFGAKRIDAIRAVDIDVFKSRKLRDGLAPKTVNNILTSLRKALRCAQR
jgi:hypothetical protein